MRLRVDDRRCAVDFDRLGHAADLHRQRHLDGLSETDDDVVLLDGLEAVQLRLDHVGAGHQQRRVEAALGVGHGRLGALRSGQRHRHARHGEALRVGDAAGDGAGRFLRLGRPPPAASTSAASRVTKRIA